MKVSKETKVLAILLALFLLIGIGCGAAVATVGGEENVGGISSPLIIIDWITADSISNINPDDIESIDVLKNAASGAIYGAKAANGVILVT